MGIIFACKNYRDCCWAMVTRSTVQSCRVGCDSEATTTSSIITNNKQVRNFRTCLLFFTTTEQPFEQLVACSTDKDSATRGAFAEGDKRLVNGSCPKRANSKKREPKLSFLLLLPKQLQSNGHAKCHKVAPRGLRSQSNCNWFNGMAPKGTNTFL